MALTTLKPGNRLKKLKSKPRLSSSVNGPANTWGTGGARGWKWQKLRETILHEQRYTCQECGRVRLPSQLDLDHIVNVAAGGDMYDKRNLQLLCRDPCHRLKTQREAKLAQHGHN